MIISKSWPWRSAFSLLSFCEVKIAFIWRTTFTGFFSISAASRTLRHCACAAKKKFWKSTKFPKIICRNPRKWMWRWRIFVNFPPTPFFSHILDISIYCHLVLQMLIISLFSFSHNSLIIRDSFTLSFNAQHLFVSRVHFTKDGCCTNPEWFYALLTLH